MKELILSSLLGAVMILPAQAAAAEGVYYFSNTGVFHLTVAGAANVETSHDLRTWTKFATVSQETGLDDLLSRQLDRRFYRIHTAPGTTSLIGYIKLTLPPGKTAVLGNSFASPLRLNSADVRNAFFGVTNPSVKVSLYTNGNFGPHVFNGKAGTWEPILRPIRPQEGFALENTGTTFLTIRMAGEVHHVTIHKPVPAGASLLAPAFPFAGPLADLLEIPAQDGTQVLVFDHHAQSYQTSSFDTLDGTGKWNPPLPDFLPGRAFILKAPKALIWTNSVPPQSR